MTVLVLLVLNVLCNLHARHLRRPHRLVSNQMYSLILRDVRCLAPALYWPLLISSINIVEVIYPSQVDLHLHRYSYPVDSSTRRVQNIDWREVDYQIKYVNALVSFEFQLIRFIVLITIIKWSTSVSLHSPSRRFASFLTSYTGKYLHLFRYLATLRRPQLATNIGQRIEQGTRGSHFPRLRNIW